MTCLVYYVVRQRKGWGVEHDGMVRSGHSTRHEAIETAMARAAAAQADGYECRIRVQEDVAGGGWRETRSFAPVSRDD